MKKSLCILSLLFVVHILTANVFTLKTGTPFTGVYVSTSDFADIDGDGDQDQLITGNGPSGKITKLYRNDGAGNFTEITGTGLVAVENGDVAFADVDNDNDLDVLITGYKGSLLNTADLYLNDGSGNFTLTSTPFDGVAYGSVKFADIDGDYDQDVLITGINSSSTRVAKLYTNNGSGVFTLVSSPFDGVAYGSVDFANIDTDSDVDVLITGYNSANQKIAQLYSNNGSGVFSLVAGTPFDGVRYSSVLFGDIDGDNDMDVVISGETTSKRITKLYKNNGSGTFSLLTGPALDGAIYGDVAFADMNGDSTLDLIVTGNDTNNVRIASLYYNDGTGVFTLDTNMPFSGVVTGDFSIADVDNDLDLDILITGYNNSAVRIAELYLNTCPSESDTTFYLTSCDPADTGTVVQNFTNISGCDSIVTTITTLLPSHADTVNLTSCNPTDTGTVVQNFTNIFGCDSIVTTITTLLPSHADTVNLTSCNPADTGTVIQNFTNIFGCDSIVTTITTLLPSHADTVNLTSCNPADTGTVVQNLTNIFGCDSIVTTITTLLPSHADTVNLTSCNPADTGTVVQNFTNIFGCDSIVTTITTLLPSHADTVNLTSCNPADTGTVVQNFTNIFGCDSIVTTITTFTDLITANITVNGNTLEASPVGLNYQWLDCDDNLTPIPGATGQTFTPTTSGHYSVEISSDSCLSVSACQEAIPVGLDKNSLKPDITRFSALVDNLIHVDFSHPFEQLDVKLFDQVGRELVSGQLYHQSSVELHVAGYDRGLYYLQITGNNKTVLLKIVKQ